MNITLPALEGKNLIFVGKGKEWQSFEVFATKYLSPLTLKNIYINDENRAQYDSFLKSCDLTNTVIVKTAGYAGRLMPVPYTTPTRIFFDCAKQLKSKTIAVTGTKGKTTTSSLLAAVLKASGKDVRLCGNMGLPMLDTLEGATDQTIFVIEASSYQLAELSVSPDIAIITNLYHDHIDYHGTLEAYWEAKHNIMRYMDEKGTVLYSPETELVAEWLKNSPAKAIAIDPQEAVDMSKAKLIGDHNKSNFLLVRACADLLGVSRSTTTQTFHDFEPIRHRLQPVRTVRGITFVDDAIGSNPEATMAGIKALIQNKGPIGCIFLGGVDREYDYTGLASLLKLLNVPALVLFPETGKKIAALFDESYKPNMFETSDMKEAVVWAADNTPSGSICLLSTAAPSTGLWTSFEEKGSMFQQFVLELSEL